MSILSAHSPDRIDLFRSSMLQAEVLSLTKALLDPLIQEVFQEHKTRFGTADKDVFKPAITLWAMISQLLFSGKGRSCKAVAGRVVSLFTQLAGRVVAQNLGNYCFAKAKIPVEAVRGIALSIENPSGANHV